uniref:uncharacterized protein isoform X3 n=1 Tax=Myxine glutinosa TaxID=7769 RepID=UPI00358E4FD4
MVEMEAFSAWLQVQGLRTETAHAVVKKLGIESQEAFRACIDPAPVKAELFVMAKQRLPFVMYAELRSFVESHCEPRHARPAGSPLVSVLCSMLNLVSRELSSCAQKLNFLDVSPNYEGADGVQMENGGMYGVRSDSIRLDLQEERVNAEPDMPGWEISNLPNTLDSPATEPPATQLLATQPPATEPPAMKAPSTPIVKTTECIIHVCASEIKNIKPFADDKWLKILSTSDSRKSFKNFDTSKYRTIIVALPEYPLAHQGYHSKCYKNFTAIPTRKSSASTPQQPVKSKQFRSVTSPCTSQLNVGIFSNECIFCEKYAKQRRDRTKEFPRKIETKKAELKIREIVNTLKLANVFVKIAGVDLITKEAKVHHSCRSENNKAAERLSKKLVTMPEESSDKKNLNLAFEEICQYIEKYVIGSSRPEHLQSIYDRYLAICEDLEVKAVTGSSQYFFQLLTKRFASRLKLTLKSKKEGYYVYSATMIVL